MTDLPTLTIVETDTADLATLEGAVALFATPDGKLDLGARKMNSVCKRRSCARSKAPRLKRPKRAMRLSWDIRPASLQAR